MSLLYIHSPLCDVLLYGGVGAVCVCYHVGRVNSVDRITGNFVVGTGSSCALYPIGNDRHPVPSLVGKMATSTSKRLEKLQNVDQV